jgi:hypothetical protein
MSVLGWWIVIKTIFLSEIAKSLIVLMMLSAVKASKPEVGWN